jgi:hypothetical protein
MEAQVEELIRIITTPHLPDDPGEAQDNLLKAVKNNDQEKFDEIYCEFPEDTYPFQAMGNT